MWSIRTSDNMTRKALFCISALLQSQKFSNFRKGGYLSIRPQLHDLLWSTTNIFNTGIKLWHGNFELVCTNSGKETSFSKSGDMLTRCTYLLSPRQVFNAIVKEQLFTFPQIFGSKQAESQLFFNYNNSHFAICPFDTVIHHSSKSICFCGINAKGCEECKQASIME